jgi:hypothetical protein
LLTLLLLGFVGRQDAAYASMMTLFLAWRHKNNLKNLAGGHLTVERPGTVAPMDPGQRFTPNTR